MRLALMILAVTACGASTGASTAPLDADLSTHCLQLDRQIRDALEMPGASCNTDSECGFIGGQIGFPTCNCAPSVVDCSGLPIPNNAPGLPIARPLIAQFIADGCPDLFQACDCAPRTALHCVNHGCTAAEQSCFPDPIDAGIDAAIDATVPSDI